MLSTTGKRPNITAEQVQGQKINHVGRVGKHIVFKLDDGYLISHLRMTGQWFFSDQDQPVPNADKHFRWGLTIRDHSGKFAGFLWFRDVRKFGTLDWSPTLTEYEPFSRIGPDGLSLNDPKVALLIATRASKSRRPIKNFLLDQAVVAGVGNIYASEVLHETRTDPTTPARDLSSTKIKDICQKLYEIFNHAIDLGGSSLSDYTGGHYHEVLKVYGREGEPCDVCSEKIERIMQASRSTFYCPNCQGAGE